MMRPRPTCLQQLALALGGVLAAALMATLLLLLFPALLPDTGRDAMRTEAGTSLDVTFRVSDGDMFWVLPGDVAPPSDDPILEQYTLAWDEDGFRVPQQPATTYPIAIFGDSFTEGANVPLPYPDLLATHLGVPVRNYGYRGYGPYEILEVAEQYASADPRTWVLYAHFSGNDLSEVLRTEQARVSERTPFFKLPFALQQASENLQAQATALSTPDPNANYKYPMPVIIGSNFYEMAFLDIYFWWQLAPRDTTFNNSRTFSVIGDVLSSIDNAVTAETCRAVIFIPTKEQLYYPFIHESSRRWLRPVAYRPGLLGEDRLLALYEAPFTPAQEPDIIADMQAQRDAIAQLADQHGWQFIDLLQPFQEAVAAGQLLYYRYDTHWNQAGHELAAQTIAEAMQATTDCP